MTEMKCWAAIKPMLPSDQVMVDYYALLPHINRLRLYIHAQLESSPAYVKAKRGITQKLPVSMLCVALDLG